ncbi:branched-chain amino acid ABC transporter permease [Ramlibacter sp. WS9]|uniref:branched-chain amino acid ABC transporter permease n=1 Tax=Ramlibacter sp. WS9 TaxID=1882741 RepID=UPI001144226A|nr:branched-chain amino acid ABC transporter permease [Ramlibacter sp. WS9]ROZ79770.1 branched-chain amino acid ABC transporter permease [Ramlibacter sp. WS9]
MSEMLPFLVSGLGVGAVYAMSGVGLVVLYRSSGVLNFAFGALGAIAAYVAWSALDHEWPLALAALAAVFTAVAISFAYGRLLAPGLAESDPTVRSVGTLGLALVLLGFTEWFWGEQPRRLVLPTDSGAIELADVRLTYTRVVGLALAISMMTAVGLLLARTRIGLAMRALADQRGLSAILGIRVLQVDTAAWVISGAFAGVCGLLLGNIVRLQATVLTFLVIPAFAAAIIGRLSSLPATVAAGLAIGMLEAVAVLVPGFSPFRTATPFLIALAAIVLWRDASRKA